MREEAEEEAIINRLAVAQRYKLRQNAHKEHWSLAPPAALFRRLEEEVQELAEALMFAAAQPDWAERVLHEAADVANFAAMIADVVAREAAGR